MRSIKQLALIVPCVLIGAFAGVAVFFISLAFTVYCLVRYRTFWIAAGILVGMMLFDFSDMPTRAEETTFRLGQRGVGY